jgi:SAM-dependent methyltransferase
MFTPLSLHELKAPSDNFCSVPDSFVRFLCQYQDPIVRWIDEQQEETSQFFIKNTLNFVQSKNQFLVIGEPEKTVLTAEYVRFLGDFRDILLLLGRKQQRHLPNLLFDVLAVHQTQLEQFVLDLASSNESRDFVFSTPVCDYYSPELQLSILHTRVEHLLEPILDLGCGQTGELIHFLRTQGKQAFGVERSGSTSQFIINADWFDFPLIPSFWGTIISHMAFSNHFLHHYLRPRGYLEQYAQRYMDVLSALKPQGSFLYTPGLPFIEELLPRDIYQIERFPISHLAGNPIENYFRTQHGIDVFYACRITRLPQK